MMKKALLETSLGMLILCGLLITGGSRLGAAQSPATGENPEGSPVISSVSPITAAVSQTITVQGSGFGNLQPTLMNVGDGSVDTVGGGTTPTIFILDENAENGWQAGIQKNSTWGWDSIGIILVSWSDNKIVLGGFGSAVGTDGQTEWLISSGDPMLIDVQTVNGEANYTTKVISGHPLQSSSSTSPGSHPVISSVSSIADELLQTITIQGSGFGDVLPQTQSLGDGSVDTIDGGYTPSMQVRDNSLINGWTGGYQGNGVGIILVSWSDTKIVLGGFGRSLSTTGQGEWNLMPGDPIQVLVKVSGQVASYSTSVLGSLPSTSNNGATPIISLVSQISTSIIQKIVITGSGFGNIQPQLMSLGDGSVDTVGSGSTPVIQVHNDGWDGWEAGTQDGPSTGADSIGVMLDNWSDGQIILGGFGSALNDGNGQWQLLSGDPIRIVVMTTGGVAIYETKVAGNSGMTSNFAPPPQEPKLAVFCQSFTSLDNFRVEISGNLTQSGVGIPDAPILLAYSVTGGGSWLNLTMVNTDSVGDFLAEWLPSVTGNFVINATYAGNVTLAATSTVVSFAVIPYNSAVSQDIFSVASNSTVTDLGFNSTSGQLSFTVTGPSGTRGYADVYIAKSLVNETSTIKAFIDGDAATFTISSTADSWMLHFNYHHSAHQVTIDLNAPDTNPPLDTTKLFQGIAIGAIISISVILSIFLFLRKNRKRTQINA
jgi:hypothetical protein